MNMIRTESEPLTPLVHTMLSTNGRLIWSGILTEEKQSVIDVARTRGYSLLEETFEEEWWCGVFTAVPAIPV
jgi:ribosomal protein L11 methylase PrmA